ncbi:bZIP transcription factor 27 [Spinacia oleracea]|uniref:BZIP transcription factor 27 n=1 Tax=Spinacia oleracea TaxID=3562 RepID=A0ABM3RJ26_SPIOL|nr:bZIP transcription factor 27-like [Spinacia oleracea]
MEEIWDHINPLSNTQIHHVQPPTPSPPFNGFFFQDFSVLPPPPPPPPPTHPQPPQIRPVAAVDRKTKRLINCRESANRSRARKKAYIEELELIVEDLKAKNKRLKDDNENRKKPHLQAHCTPLLFFSVR